MKQRILKFPDSFIWGAATSSHQVEGNNINDWSEWEKVNAERLAEKAKSYRQDWQKKMFPEMLKKENYISGLACDHYHLYEKDFDLMKSLGMNSYRFSIEWSRVEPEEGRWNLKEVQHYQDMVKALKKRKIEPFVTLWHFTNPLWVRDIGGWENPETVRHFVRYVNYVVPFLKEVGVKFWMPFNEAQNYVGQSYLTGAWPPQVKNIFRAKRVLKNFEIAHKESYEIIHKHQSGAMVGVVHIVNYHIAYENLFWNRILVKIFDYITDKRFLGSLIDFTDFIGFNYYHTAFVNFNPPDIRNFGVEIKNPNDWVSDLGWQIYPEGIYHLLKRSARWGKPIYITENGLADRGDVSREGFIREHLKWVWRAINEGVPVKGYFYWSLLDNFEWSEGFWPRFGLVEVNYKTMERKVRQSAWEYAKIVKENGIEVDSQISK